MTQSIGPIDLVMRHLNLDFKAACRWLADENNIILEEWKPQTSDISHQTSSTMKAVGMVAAATVALLVIYESGLLIPLGLIGLATSGLLK